MLFLKALANVDAKHGVNGILPAVPEPSSWLMMLLGLGIVGGSIEFRRRRKAAPRFALSA